jgi:hypothetical protein
LIEPNPTKPNQKEPKRTKPNQTRQKKRKEMKRKENTISNAFRGYLSFPTPAGWGTGVN